jgi:glycosyltransferase involved in cell wall biosynthesis
MITFVGLRLSGEKGTIYQFVDTIIGSLGGLFLIMRIKKFRPDIVIIPDHGAVSAFWPKIKDAKSILISHHNPARFLNNPLIGSQSEKDVELALKVEKRALRNIDAVICPSEYMKSAFLRTYSFSGPVEVIPNIISNETIVSIKKNNFAEKIGLRPNTPIAYIPSAGSIFKGKDFVFEIIRRVASQFEKPICFYLTGEIDPVLMYCLTFLPKNAVVYAPGRLPYHENISNIKTCTICVSPTLLESFGLSLLEAHVCGLPVISFDVGGNREIVRDGETGYLVPYLEVEELIDRTVFLLTHEDVYAEMSENSMKHSITRFSSAMTVNKYLSFFEKRL